MGYIYLHSIQYHLASKFIPIFKDLQVGGQISLCALLDGTANFTHHISMTWFFLSTESLCYGLEEVAHIPSRARIEKVARALIEKGHGWEVFGTWWYPKYKVTLDMGLAMGNVSTALASA
jgi:hypothetical protein